MELHGALVDQGATPAQHRPWGVAADRKPALWAAGAWRVAGCMDKGQLAAAGAQRAGQGPSCKVVWLIRGSNTRIEAQCIPASHGRSTMAANALPGVLHAIAQRRPTAHFRAGDDTAELAILPPPRDRDRSRVAALYAGKLSLLGGLSLNEVPF